MATVHETDWLNVRSDQEIRPVRHLRLVEAQPEVFPTGRSISARRRARERMLRRRRRTLVVAALVASFVVLAWPGHAFGGTTSTGSLVDAGSGAQLAPGMVYVVHDGDTVASIARMVDTSHVASVTSAIVAELGSSTVVPGEHIVIP
jgi:hypothetical protein